MEVSLSVFLFVRLFLNDVGSLRATIALCNVKLYSLTFIESLEAIALDCGEMYEDISAVIGCDKSITFLCVEPLNLACCHTIYESPILVYSYH